MYYNFYGNQICGHAVKSQQSAYINTLSSVEYQQKRQEVYYDTYTSTYNECYQKSFQNSFKKNFSYKDAHEQAEKELSSQVTKKVDDWMKNNYQPTQQDYMNIASKIQITCNSILWGCNVCWQDFCTSHSSVCGNNISNLTMK